MSVSKTQCKIVRKAKKTEEDLIAILLNTNIKNINWGKFSYLIQDNRESEFTMLLGRNPWEA